MSLKVLLRCSDDEFEKLLAMTDIEGVMDIIAELQTEMDKEQRKFDELSAAISFLTDPSTAEFKRLSMELVKSQNMLSLLVSRNMHCFQVSQEPEDEPGNYSSDLNSTDTVGNTHRVDDSSPHNIPMNTSELHCASSKNNNNNNADSLNAVKSSVKQQTSHINTLSSTKDVEESNDSSTLSPRLESTATLSVISPRQTTQEKKPRRVLKVKTTSLCGERSVTLSTCNSSGNSASSKTKYESRTQYHSNNSSPRDCTSDRHLPRNTASSVTSEKRTELVEPPTIRCTQTAVLLVNTISTTPTSVNTISSKNITKSSTHQSVSPTNDIISRRRASYTIQTKIPASDLSPRSDVSNLGTPRSFVSVMSPRSDTSTVNSSRSYISSSPLPVSSILDLDMPETNIDGESPWEERTTPGGDIVSDKISCTTDESGFTSASSDSDMTLIAPDIVYDYHSEDEDKVEERVFMKNWNPSKLIDELYTIKLAKEPSTNTDHVINMEGYLERLPIGKTKNTLLKTWKRTYCKVVDGIMYFYNSKSSVESQSYMSLMGGVLEELSNNMIGIDDMRGHYLMVRCSSPTNHLDWKRSFYTQIKCSPHSTYIRPCLSSRDNSHVPKVIIIDIGSTSIRAGILGNTPSYPQLFFPSVTSTNEKGQVVIGKDAYLPENRTNGLHRPVAACKDAADTYRINVQVLPDIFRKIFTELNVDVSDYTILLSTPHNFSLRLKEEVINILIHGNNVAGVNMVNQSLLTPYIYSATSGVVVDIGERIEIVAIADGYLVDGGLSRQTFGGTQITETLNTYLVEYRLFTPVEHLLPRLVKEKTCFVSQDYGDNLLKYMCNEKECEVTVDLDEFDLPPNFHIRNISVDTARFKAPEGLLKTELLGVDSPTLPCLIQEVVNSCPMDMRREMWQSIYLSGGTTLTKGFPERLLKQLGKIVPSSVNVQVHASPHRYHAAYIGACMLAKLPNFKESCITREEWSSSGSASLSKWRRYFQG